MLRRQELLGIDNNDLSAEELETKLNKSVIDSKEHKKKVIESKEEELLELYPTEIIGDSETTQWRIKKAIGSIKQGKFRKTRLTCYLNTWEKVKKRHRRKFRCLTTKEN